MKKLRIKGVNNPRDMVQTQTACLLSFYVILLLVCYCQLQQLSICLLSVCVLHSLIHIHTHMLHAEIITLILILGQLLKEFTICFLSITFQSLSPLYHSIFSTFNQITNVFAFHFGALHTELQKIDPSLAVSCQLVQFFNLSSHSLEVKNPLEEKNTFHLTR